LELSCLLGVVVLMFAFVQFDTVFGLRDRLFQEPATRAIFNVWYSVYVVSFTLGCIRLIHRRSRYVAVLLLIGFLCSAMTGSRSMTMLPALDVLIAFMVVYRGRLRLLRIVGAAGVLVVVIGLVTLSRNAEQSESASDSGFELPLVTLMYGNTVSDLRDAAWVLSAWEGKGELLLGRSYAAAAISFVPRSLSDFREQYAIGTYTNELVDIDSTIHPGLRGGKFLEPYLNFGTLGVLLIGYFAGKFLSRTSDFMLRQPPTSRGLARAYSAILPFFMFSQLLISAGAWVAYVLLFVLVVGGPSQARTQRFSHAVS
jgi:hypothetical protein